MGIVLGVVFGCAFSITGLVARTWIRRGIQVVFIAAFVAIVMIFVQSDNFARIISGVVFSLAVVLVDYARKRMNKTSVPR